MSDRDYYEILGLTPRADGAMVDQAYWHLARKYQALATTNSRAQYMLDELNEAYGVLGNPKLREQYDAFRDDVLIQRGMIKPVKAKQQKKPQDAQSSGDSAGLPSIHIENGRTYAVSAIIVLLACAAAWQGVSFLLAGPLMIAGLVLALSPALRRIKLPSVSMPSVEMPSVSVPSVNMPSISAPKLSVPSMPEVPLGIGSSRDEPMDADELRQSTAATIARWRKSVGLQASRGADEPPDQTLVEIFESEKEIESADEPLAAVLDILRGSRTGPTEVR
jgi:hypothetical protein